jgi:asparagine synthase (glutamine-hydrolysing)
LRLIQDAVRLRLRSDVPVGTCLSGGLDSSAIVALATRQLDGGRMNSFSAVYPVKGLDETRFVDIVSTQFNTIQHKITPDPDRFLERMQRITWHQDIPTAGASVYTQNFVMQLAHGNVTVLLDGQGADELFAGYLGHVVYHLSALRKHDPAQWFREQIAFTLGVWSHFNAALNMREFEARVSHYLRAGRQPVGFLTPEFEHLAEERQSGRVPASLKEADALNNHLYQALMRDSIPGLLHYEDRNSMAHGIEARVPFLDHRLVEFSLGIPANMKVQGVKTKVIMRKALRGVLPREVAERKDKLGYPTPLGQWLRGSLREPVNAYLHDTVFKRPWYNVERLKELWQQHQDRQRNVEHLFYRVLTADMWYSDL